MKKIFSIFLSTLLIMSLFTFVPASADEVASEVLLTPMFIKSFDDLNSLGVSASVPEGAEGDTCTVEVATNPTGEAGYGKAAKIAAKVGEEVKSYKAVLTPNGDMPYPQNLINVAQKETYKSTADVLSLSIDTLVDNNTASELSLTFYYRTSVAGAWNTGGRGSYTIKFYPDKTITFNGKNPISYDFDKWYNVSIVINNSTGKLYALVDGKVQATVNFENLSPALNFKNTITTFYMETVFSGNNKNVDDVMYLDNYRLYYAPAKKANVVETDAADIKEVNKYQFNSFVNNMFDTDVEGNIIAPDGTYLVAGIDNTTFASDSEHGSVGKIQVMGGASYATKAYYVRSRKAHFASIPAEANLLGYGIDYYTGAALGTGCSAGDFVITVQHQAASAEKATSIEAFSVKFGPNSGVIRFAKNITNATSCEVKINPNTWYNFKALFDFKNSELLLLVNDIIYSTVPFSILAEKAPTLEGLKNSKVDGLSLTFYNDRPELRTFYIDNIANIYGTIPETNSKPEYTNQSAVVIVNRSQLAGSNTLGVNIDIMNKGVENIYVIANIISGDGRMVAVALENVTFEADDYVKEVNLYLNNLPSDIATGDYKVNVMLWDKASLQPIVTEKIVMPD